ncbi:MAG: ATP-binding protein [Acidobacteriaceae bacterium]|nr:ATP-binding protein [Acidobacteriaceae bacterium]
MAWRDSGESDHTQIELDSTLESVDEAEAIATREAKNMGFEEEDQAQIGMAVREWMVNAVVHGNRYSGKKKVHMAIQRAKESLAFVIGDEGEGFDLSSLPDPLAPENLLRQSGRGILLVRAFMDEFDVHPRPGGGTEARLVKNLAKS